MRKVSFEEAVGAVHKRDKRFKPDAYHFLRETLEYTVKTMRKDELVEHRHVSGRELLDGLHEYALKEFGSMALTVLESWGVRSGEDVGAMVYNLIQEDAFHNSEEDHPADFEGWISFDKAFLEPFRPKRSVLAGQEDSPGAEDPSPPCSVEDAEPATSSEA